MEETLSKNGITLKKIDPELIDQIWKSDRPAQPSSAINALPMDFAGKQFNAISFIYYLILNKEQFHGIPSRDVLKHKVLKGHNISTRVCI